MRRAMVGPLMEAHGGYAQHGAGGVYSVHNGVSCGLLKRLVAPKMRKAHDK